MNLTQQDIDSILHVIDDSPYDELRLETNGVSVYLKRTAEGWTQQQQTLKQPQLLQGATAATQTAIAQAAPLAAEPAATEAGLVDVRASMVGTFYRAPQPGAAPFVGIGTRVDVNSVIAIVEVMKLMCSIPAGVSGEVREILAEDAQLVQKGQLLMRVKPAAANA
jgi:acetyl-CoA carboxylase biotin carboxyl carrier protein